MENTSNKTTLVIGASENPERYSNIATKLLRKYDHNVVAIGNKVGKIDDVDIVTGKPILQNIDTVTLYIIPKFQRDYYDYILSIKPRRIIFNPGTENDELINIATNNNISAIVACTLVLLKTNQY